MEKGLYNVRTLKAELNSKGINKVAWKVAPKSGKCYLLISPTEVLWAGEETSNLIKAKKVKAADLFVGNMDYKDDEGDVQTSTHIFFNPLANVETLYEEEL